MHRIMADLMSKNFEVVTRPTEENYTMHIPEGDPDNVGRLGVQGVYSRIYQGQQMMLRIANSGPLSKNLEQHDTSGGRPHDYPGGTKFVIEPSYLLDDNGDEVSDTISVMGGELPFSVGRYRHIRLSDVAGGNRHIIEHPKIAVLTQARNVDDEFEYLAMAVWTEYYNGSDIYISLLKNRRMDQAMSTNDRPYLWGDPALITLPNRPAGGVIFDACDIVEFDDGSIFLVVGCYDSNYLAAYVYRTVDYGTTWTYCGKSASISSAVIVAQAIAIERINERLVIAHQFFADAGMVTQTYGACLYSDDFGKTVNTSANNFDDSLHGASTLWNNLGVDLAVGKDKVLYMAYTLPIDGGTEFDIYTSKTLDGVNYSGALDTTLRGTCPSLVEDVSGCWLLYYMEGTVAAPGLGELTAGFNLVNPSDNSWSTTVQPFATYHSIEANSYWRSFAAASISNMAYVSVLCSRLTASAVNWYSDLGEMKCAMWSSITNVQHLNVDSVRSLWDYMWFANCYPSTSDSEPNIHVWTRSLAMAATATLTEDATAQRSFLRIVAPTTSATDTCQYYIVPTTIMRDVGCSVRCSLRVNTGDARVSIRAKTATGNTFVDVIVLFDQTSGKIVVFDNVASAVVNTYTPTNWLITDWNLYQIDVYGTGVRIYRAGSVYEEILHFEQLLDLTLTTTAGGAEQVKFGVCSIVNYGAVTSADFEYVFVNTAGFSTYESLTTTWNPLTNVMGKKVYFNPIGLYGGLGAKFDGSYGVEDDQWLVETGAIYEIENIFLPSPSIFWKSSSLATNVSAEPDEVFVWKQKDSTTGEMHQTVTGIAVFGRNWPYCKLEGSTDGASYNSLFDSLTDDTLAYIMKFDHDGSSNYNQATVKLATGMPALHVNRFASTPEITYYLMATEGTDKFHIYKIVENDEDTFYLDTCPTHGFTDGDELIVFSDRFYYDLGTTADDRGATTFTRGQYRYFRLTVYGSDGGHGADDQLIFPDSDGGVKKLGSIHLGRVYDLPNEEWGVNISLQPAMSVVESRSARKEYRRVGIAKRNISLGYTGVIERGLGINPVVDLNRALGWGEYPLVFVDDADILTYGDVAGSSPEYGDYTHPNPILVRMVDGYTMSRVAFSLESENQGDETMELVRNVVDISGIRLEEVV